MKRLLPLIAILAGCTPPAAPEKADPAPAVSKSNPPATARPSSGVAPMGSGYAGGMTPVAGADIVGGAGMGGMGTAAKDMARRAATSSQQAPGLGTEGE